LSCSDRLNLTTLNNNCCAADIHAGRNNVCICNYRFHRLFSFLPSEAGMRISSENVKM
jgi:hypothetical protein